MKQQVLFFQGGGSREDYEADKKLVASLKEKLGADYTVQYPALPEEQAPDFGRRVQLTNAVQPSDDNIILVAHSLGASMLLICLAEERINKKIAGIFLLATPWWSGDEDWVAPLKLSPGFEKQLDQTIPLFFYHCTDDEEVPFEQLAVYKQRLPWATFREVPAGGHQFDNDLTLVAKDIRGLSLV